jgi:hypothetical protein
MFKQNQIRFQKKISRNQDLELLNSDFEITKKWNLWPDRSSNPLTRNPKKYFSQSDEDGIIEKILLRLEINHTGKVLEFGIGNGTENNSLALIAKGWESYWIGAENLEFKFPKSRRHHFNQCFITLDNVSDLADKALRNLNTTRDSLELISLDLDGNDWHFVNALLETSLYPKVWVCEYNAKFPPGVNWIMPYDQKHEWAGDDYFGASFTSFVELFRKHNYFPVACSVQGANIFFVREQDRSYFLDIDLDEDSLYQPPFYFLVQNWGHKKTARTYEIIFQTNI